MAGDRVELWVQTQEEKGIDVNLVKERLKRLCIETPSWGYGDSGTRFKVFQQVGIPRNPYEKLEDAAMVHKLTGVCPKVAIHIPWDRVDDYQKLSDFANEQGIEIGAVNPNLFQENEYLSGSLCHPQKDVREKAVNHVIECIDIMREVHSNVISLWLPDGTNYPGQDSFRRRKHHLMESLSRVYSVLPESARLLIEYKFFEPAFYHTDLADWGMAYNYAEKLGDKAQVLVDLGHHPQGTNIAQIVAFLLDEGKLGGFHFNNRKYADDDLMVGTIDPYELYLICRELVDGEEDSQTSNCAKNLAYMIDQSHNIEPKIPAMLRSVMNIQTAFAKAMLVQCSKLAELQQNADVIGAESLIKDAFETDARPLLRLVREEMGVPVDPIAAYFQSGYPEKIKSRGVGGQGWT